MNRNALRVWDAIHADVAKITRLIVEAEQYDDAIFSAFRFVEGEIQERIQSKSIGITLLNEAFDGQPPKIRISDDSRDREGIKKLFEGALTNMRNDRGHKKVPFLPCNNAIACYQHLTFASLLLYLLDRDKNAYPQIYSIRVFGASDQPRAELVGAQFPANCTVDAGQVAIQIVRFKPELIEVILPTNFSGKLRIVAQDRSSNEVYCDTSLVGQDAENRYETISSEIPLYSNATCTQMRSGLVGLLISATEGGRDFVRIMPTYPNIYKAGCYITHGPHTAESVGESWYRDPASDEIKYAWTASLIATPTVIGSVSKWELGGIELLPKKIKTEVGEPRTLCAMGWESDGVVRRKVDITRKAKWESSDLDIAFSKDGIVYAKKFGTANIECKYEGFHATSKLIVGHYSKGEKAQFYAGIARLQQIRFDRSDNMYICNQSDAVFRLNAAGGVEKIISIAGLDERPHGIDCIAIDEDRNLYVNSIGQRCCLRFPWLGDSYGQPVELGDKFDGTKKGIAVDSSGNVFIAIMDGVSRGGCVLCINADGKESSFETLDMPIYIALDKDGNICIPSRNHQAVHIYSRVGDLLKTIPIDFNDAPSDIMVSDDGAFYITMFNAGVLLKVENDGLTTSTKVVATGFQSPSGVTMDSKGRLFVSNFTGDSNSIDVVYV